MSAAAPSAKTFSSGEQPVPLVELFTSEGCSSCPPAEHWLGELREEEGLWRDFVPVAWHVNYWDRLGWPDKFKEIFILTFTVRYFHLNFRPSEKDTGFLL